MTLNPLASNEVPSSDSEFVISRTFDAPLALVWKAWTEPVGLAQWFGPKGLGLRVAKVDLRPGGEFRYAMQIPGGDEVWAKFVYREVIAPTKMVFVLSFTDPEGTPIRHPMGPGFPIAMLNTVVLAEENGATTVTVRSTPLDAAPEEIQVFVEGHDSMRQGWGGTFEQLADYLAKA